MNLDCRISIHSDSPIFVLFIAGGEEREQPLAFAQSLHLLNRAAAQPFQPPGSLPLASQ